MKRLFWLAALSCLISTASASDLDCGVATAAASGTCTAAQSAFIVANSRFLCPYVGTAGIGCDESIADSGMYGLCGIITGYFDCYRGDRAALATINSYLEDIKGTVDDIDTKFEVGFFEAKFTIYINKIRAAADRYKLNVIDKSTNTGTGLIKDSALVRNWRDDVLGDGDYNVRGALDIIEDMIDGTDGIFQQPTVYELANNNNLCTIDIYEFLNAVIMEGTILAFIALEMRGDRVHPWYKNQLVKRLKLNRKKYNEGCPYYTPSDSQLRYEGIWGTWGPMETCPRGGYAISFSVRVEEYELFSDLKNWEKFDNTCLNSICLQCSAGGEVCSRVGFWGNWWTSPKCQEGYIGSNFRFEGRQGGAHDDTAGNDLRLACGIKGIWKETGNGGELGDWQNPNKFCPAPQRICGLKTRVERMLGGGDNDDTALNGVHFQCCKDIDI